MKKCICLLTMLVAFLTISAGTAFGEADSHDALIEKADAYYRAGGLDNYKQAIDLYKAVIAEDPEHFEAYWKLARSIREYGMEHQRLGIEGFEDVCREYGQKGMAYAQKAIDLNPEHPGGHLYYGINVGIYSDGVGIITALREGLKDKTQSSFEKAYELDRYFENGAAILSLGRFWQVVPWPFRDISKSEEFYREFQKTEYFDKVIEGRIYLAELLKGKRGRRHDPEAKQLLEEALQMDAHPYWHNMARELLKGL